MKQLGLMSLPYTQEQIEKIALTAARGGFELLDLRACAREQLSQDALRDCEILHGYFPAPLIKRAGALKWLHTPSAGVDRFVDESLYPNKDVILTNSSGAFGVSIAEYLLCALLMLLRHMDRYMPAQRRREWAYLGSAGQIDRMRITVVGLGDIGSNFARRARAMGARVRGVRRTQAPCPDYLEAVYAVSQLDEALKDADAVALCLPGTKDTRNLLNQRRIRALKKGAYVLNAGRGQCLDQVALRAALEDGHIAGAALDVFETEPLPPEDPLWSAPNLIITPHISGRDIDPVNAARIFEIFMDNLNRYLDGRPLTNVVDRALGY